MYRTVSREAPLKINYWIKRKIDFHLRAMLIPSIVRIWKRDASVDMGCLRAQMKIAVLSTLKQRKYQQIYLMRVHLIN